MKNDYLKDLDDWDNESQQILLSLAKNNEFISFEEMEKGVLGKGKNIFDGIKTNKTFQDISNEIAIESPFGKQSIFYNYFVTISNPKDKVIKDEKKFYTNFIACKSGSEVFERYNDDQNIADNEMNIYCEEEVLESQTSLEQHVV
ncbi:MULTISPECIES: hypothetical protein [Empedobacter]|uniref:Uncharacterized protein n=1 Tax=Empedobacter falsenii TaxID=343874 RepID=A0A7H9DPW1_9FLAO|nr:MULTISPECIES: hypothetical protein [Empedobacter]QLL57193.1 hypothetical protein FH779_03415 [Empedobacter falsenii]